MHIDTGGGNAIGRLYVQAYVCIYIVYNII